MENQGLRVNLMAVGQTQKQEVNADSAQQLPVTMSKYIRLLILTCEEHTLGLLTTAVLTPLASAVLAVLARATLTPLGERAGRGSGWLSRKFAH